ncbi:lantibiotic dehydratase [Streptomyces sp. NPDC057939]|uniref:lantibiotic dehydratase n=1 Tax=Streptomyces sp. NPDC057939 TaxID=3346284 RepID=UPI0036E4ABDD
MRRRVFDPAPGAQARIPLRPFTARPGACGGLLEEAVFLAASDLLEPRGTDGRGGAASNGSTGRERSLRSYEIRSRTRPTPSGVFSGIAPVRFTRVPTGAERLVLGTAHRAVTAPSGLWLAQIADRMLDDPDVLDRVGVTTDNTVRAVDGRFEVEHAPVGGVVGVHSVRDTPVSRMLLRTCADGRPASDVLAHLRGLLAGTTDPAPERTPGDRAANHLPTEHRPTEHRLAEHRSTEHRPAEHRSTEHRPREQRPTGQRPAGDRAADRRSAHDRTARQVLLQMIRSGLLLTDLTAGGPPSLTLARIASFTRPGDAWSVLPQVRDLLARADAHPPGGTRRIELLRRAEELLKDPDPRGRPLTADTRADATIVLPRRLAEQAAEAAGVLWRTAHTKPPLAEYHRRFVGAFGIHRMVPLTDLLDAAAGLGPPEPGDGLGASDEAAPGRWAALARLAAHPWPDNEVVLTEELVDRLASPRTEPPPRSAEIHVRVVRDGTGPLRLAVCPGAGSQEAGSAAGRFAALGLMDDAPGSPPDRRAVGDGIGALVARVACRPLTPAAAALAPPADAPGPRIVVGVPARPGDLTPADLYVASDGRRLVLWSPRHGRRVVPVVPHRLTPDLLPAPVRLLRLLGQAGTRPWRTWSWGPYAELPSTPRVRHGDVILAPARWTLPWTLAEAVDRPAEFAARLDEWRTDTRPRPPRYVTVEEADRLLPLDLDDPRDREILRTRTRHGVRAVLEPLGAATDPAVVRGPDGAHLLEVVIPLRRVATGNGPVRLDPRCAPRSRARDGRETGDRQPGGHETDGREPDGCETGGREPDRATAPWLSLAVQVPGERQDAALRRLGDTLGGLPAQDAARCFWIRYATPGFGPHLRVRFGGRPEVLEDVLRPAAERWARELRACGLAGSTRWETYVPEVERYGGPACLAAAEAVFAADSALSLAALDADAFGGAAIPAEDRRILLAAAGAVSVARLVADGSPRAVATAGLSRDVRLRREALRGPFHALLPEPTVGGTALRGAWLARDTALAGYGAALTGARPAGGPTAAGASPGIAELCASDVVHMHVNRLLGPDPATERLVRSLASDALHRA